MLYTCPGHAVQPLVGAPDMASTDLRRTGVQLDQVVQGVHWSSCVNRTHAKEIGLDFISNMGWIMDPGCQIEVRVGHV